MSNEVKPQIRLTILGFPGQSGSYEVELQPNTVLAFGPQLLPYVAELGDVVAGGVIEVSGDPEGAVTANPRTIGWDPVNRVLYIKNSGTGNEGWQELIAVP